MRKFIVIVVVALVVLFGMWAYIYKTNKIIESYEKQENKESKKELISMMLETESGSGKYQETTANEWPTEGYVFNETLSKCEQGSTLSWDSTKNTVVMMGNNSDRCYVYFDKAPDTVKLSDYIINLYTTQGANNLYLHDSTLTNGAGDGSYRYAGSSETTKNFVCFGYDSKDGSCPTDYLYRIIGVFNNQVKLIKYDYVKSTLLGTDGSYYDTYLSREFGGTNKGSNTTTEIGVYHWYKTSSTNVWSESKLNTVNLNTNYMNNIGTKWSNKIAMHTWKAGGNTPSNILYSDTAQNIYNNEITSPAVDTAYDAKVGLMYASDYGYAATPSAWNTNLYSYNSSSITNVNWMYMGLFEWSITRRSDNYERAFYVEYNGRVNHNFVSGGYAVRPVFYLTSEIMYVSGSGTISSPILIN